MSKNTPPLFNTKWHHWSILFLLQNIFHKKTYSQTTKDHCWYSVTYSKWKTPEMWTVWCLTTVEISANNSAHTKAGLSVSVLCPRQFCFWCISVNVLCSISNLFCVLLAVQVALLEIMLKQYCLSERVINHHTDKSSGHCWRVMSVLLTFNTFGLLLVRWIISTLMMVQKYSVCHQFW